MADANTDGIALTSAPHPTPWYWRWQMVWWWITRKDIRKGALVTATVELPERPQEPTQLMRMRDLTLPGIYRAVGMYPWNHLIEDWDIVVDHFAGVLRVSTRWKDGRWIEATVAPGPDWVDAYKRALNIVLPEAIFDDEVVVEYNTPEM